MPRKPTQPFGNIQWSPDGSVRRNVFRLPEVKEQQEQAVFERFTNLVAETYDDIHVGAEIDSLDENDHDFRVPINEVMVTVQLTELAPREYRRLAGGSPGAGAADFQAADDALRRVVANKVDKHYAPATDPLWLVVFCTELYVLRFMTGGQLCVTSALVRAREYLANVDDLVFDQVWFTDLQTRPVQVWPNTDNGLPVRGRPVP